MGRKTSLEFFFIMCYLRVFSSVSRGRLCDMSVSFSCPLIIEQKRALSYEYNIIVSAHQWTEDFVMRVKSKEVTKGYHYFLLIFYSEGGSSRIKHEKRNGCMIGVVERYNALSPHKSLYMVLTSREGTQRQNVSRKLAETHISHEQRSVGDTRVGTGTGKNVNDEWSTPWPRRLARHLRARRNPSQKHIMTIILVLYSLISS